MLNKINLGCGTKYLKDFLNVDIRKNIKTDLRWDLNNIPYPFEDNSFIECFMDCTLAFLEKPIEVIKEMARITKQGGRIVIITPHALSYAFFSGLGHKHHFTENTFNDTAMKEFELEDSLEFIRTDFIFTNKWKKYIPFKKYLKIFLRGVYDDIRFEFKIKK